jgi:pimeloyl-ACP methyl ester carboxylesterase
MPESLAGMTPAELARLVAFLTGLRRKPGRDVPRGLQESTTNEADCVVDVYAPAHSVWPAPERGTGARRSRCTPLVMALHGLNMDAGRDDRLVRFARALARSGVTCLVPTIPALADARLAASDLDVLERLILATATRVPIPLCVTGFSVGAAYGLRVASRESVRLHVGAVVAFGAYYDLAALLDHLAQTFPGGEAAPSDGSIYAALVLARMCGDRLAPGLVPRVVEMLRGYCSRPLEEKQAFFRAHLASQPLAEAFRAVRGDSDWAALSPKGHLARLAVPVSLVHDRSDALVPIDHAVAAAAELAGSPDLRVWITNALDHVDYAGIRPRDVRAMLRALMLLVRG